MIGVVAGDCASRFVNAGFGHPRVAVERGEIRGADRAVLIQQFTRSIYASPIVEFLRTLEIADAIIDAIELLVQKGAVKPCGGIVRVNCLCQKEFMRRLRKLARAKNRKLPVSVLVANPWCYRGLGDKISGDLNGLLVDTPTWAREGLIDAAVPAGYFQGGGSTEEAVKALQTATDGKIEIWPYEWMPKTPAEFEQQALRARKLTTNHILFWEGDYLDDPEADARKAVATEMSREAAPGRR